MGFFIDTSPLSNWEHPCFYYFVDVIHGKTKKIEWDLPPNNLDKWDILTEISNEEEKKLFDLKKENISSLKSGLIPSKCYAVIISGGYNNVSNWERYWNDCSAIYSALVNVYNFQDDHIYVLISDGTNPGNDRRIGFNPAVYDSSPLDLDGDGDDDIQYAATRANITTVFNTLSSTIDSDDNLFIFTTDHGGQSSGQDVYLYLWGETITDDQFATEVNKVSAGEISIVMEQCYSGGFIDDLSSSGRVISTACRYDEPSCGMGYFTYDEFVFDWIAAIAREDPYGNPVDADTNNNGFISMKEAFDYAEANDACSETPQYSSSPYVLGLNLAVYGLIPSISGSDLVCYSSTTFSLTGQTSGLTFDWDCDASVITEISGDNNSSYVVRANTSSTSDIGWVSVNIVTGCGDTITKTKRVWVGPPEIIGIDGPMYVPTHQDTRYYPLYSDVISSPTNFMWVVDPGDGVSYDSYGWSTLVNFSYPGYYNIIYRGLNTCGWGDWYYSPNIQVYSSRSMSVSPNPTSGEATISIEQEAEAETFDETVEWELEIYDNVQNLKEKRTKLKGNSVIVNTQSWKEGVYILRAIYKDEVLQGKLVVKK